LICRAGQLPTQTRQTFLTQPHTAQSLNTVRVIPGMIATADIKTGKKTVMHYLLKPIIKARDEALSER
ncbi:MAG: hypothetical protein ACRYGR_02075, partial [Janthinobacterium lividum]